MESLRSLMIAVARGIALFLGAFSLVGLLGGLRSEGLAANRWWVDLRPLPAAMAGLLLLAAGLLLLAYGADPAPARWRRTATWIVVGVFAVAALMNAFGFYGLVLGGAIRAGWPFPLSLLVCAALGVVLWGVLQAPVRTGTSHLLLAATVAGMCIVAFPLAQMVLFGKTDYRRPADAVVVFGARVYADGRPSDALADRTRTGCRLYLDGLADSIIFSGGPGDGPVHETECMKRIALDMGVPEDAIVLDPDGVNTRATIGSTAALAQSRGIGRVLAVSHFYHLPRIKLCFGRAGVETCTVPAEESYTLAKLPFFMLREVAAFWVYYARAVAG